jgi:hypothetical protein
MRLFNLVVYLAAMMLSGSCAAMADESLWLKQQIVHSMNCLAASSTLTDRYPTAVQKVPTMLWRTFFLSCSARPARDNEVLKFQLEDGAAEGAGNPATIACGVDFLVGHSNYMYNPDNSYHWNVPCGSPPLISSSSTADSPIRR